MAVGDFGGGLLAGLQGVQAFNQQRRDNQYRQDALQLDRDRLGLDKDQFGQAVKEHEDRVAQWKEENKINQQNADSSTKNADTNARLASVSEGNLKIAEAEESRRATEFADTRATASAQDTFAQGQAYGFVDVTKPTELKVPELASALESGSNINHEGFALSVLNQTPKVEGFRFTEIDRTTVPGKAIIRGKYADGREGVMTAQGGVQEGEEVVVLDFADAAKLISNEYGHVGITAYGGNGVTEILSKLGLNEVAAREQSQQAAARTAVVQAVDATGNVGMARAFRSALAAAETEQEAQEILTDMAQTMGIEYNPPVATPRDQIVDYQVPTGAYAKDNTALGVDSRELKGRAARGRITVLDRKTARLEEAAKGQSGIALERTNAQLDELYNERQELVDGSNRESLRLINGEIEDLQARFDKAAPARKEFWQNKLDEKTAKRDEIRTALGELTPAMQTDAYKELETQLFTRLEGMSKQEIDALVDSGQLPFSPEQVSVMRQRAQEAGIQKPSDIQKLPSQERLAYYALLSTIAQDPNQREAFRNENANLLETGTTSMSAKDQDISQRDLAKIQNTLYSNVTSRMTELRQARDSDTESLRRAGSVASDIFNSSRQTFFDEDGNFKSTLESARTFAQTLPELQAKAAEFTPGTREFDLVDASVSSAVSNVVAAYVNDGDAGFVDGLVSFFFRDDPNGQMSDFNLSRVTVDDPENPTKLMYLGPGGRVVQGAEMPLTGLQEIDNNVYNIVRQRAVENARKRLQEG